MNSLKISDFKGISQEIDFEMPGNINLAIYGDNGSGKTSIFEAIRLYYFGQDLINDTIPRNAIQAERDTAISNWLDSFKCRHGADRFAIEIDSVPIDTAVSNTQQVFMLEGKSLARYDEITLDGVINAYTVHGSNLPQWQSIADDIVYTVNMVMQECFQEDVIISLSPDDGNHIIIEDTQRNLRFATGLTAYFNESKIRLVKLLCFLAYAVNAADGSAGKSPLLVLDDFVTSIDTSNRICLVKFILDNFKKFQIILMTHNVSFIIRKTKRRTEINRSGPKLKRNVTRRKTKRTSGYAFLIGRPTLFSLQNRPGFAGVRADARRSPLHHSNYI